MAWEQDSFDAEATPVVGKIWEGDPPLFFLAVGMAFIYKPIDTFTLGNAVVLVGDLLFELKKIWEERIILSSR